MAIIDCRNMNAADYFLSCNTVAQKQYEALRSFFVEKNTAKETAERFGYTLRAFNSLVSDFRKKILACQPGSDPFFKINKKGRSFKENTEELTSLITEMRKKNFSVGDIKTAIDSKGLDASERYISSELNKQGFARLPRRGKNEISALELPNIKAEKSSPIDFRPEVFATNSSGLLLFLPYLERYGIVQAIADSGYPETKVINRVSSVLAFQALKLSNIRRYSSDDLWCMDRGQGLFAGLNVLPKAAWYSSYSHRVTREMNIGFLKRLHGIWRKNDLLGDTANLDFVTVPYWGDGGHLENNWSGKRRHAMASMLTLLAQDPDSGIIDYGDTDIKHKNEHSSVLEFLDFYRKDDPKGKDLKYLVFDSKFTNYENLKKLDDSGTMFVTIRRRGKIIVDQINKLPKDKWKTMRIKNADGKGRTLRIFDSELFLKGYEDTIRQIAITGHGKIKPALIITNDFGSRAEALIRKYSRRWLVEKSIAEQTDFFHLNRVSSSMVVKVDFDLTMTILAHNLYRLLALDLERYSHFADVGLYEKFIFNSGEINIDNDKIEVKMKKKRNLPELLTVMEQNKKIKLSWMKNKRIIFSGLSYS